MLLGHLVYVSLKLITTLAMKLYGMEKKYTSTDFYLAAGKSFMTEKKNGNSFGHFMILLNKNLKFLWNILN